MPVSHSNDLLSPKKILEKLSLFQGAHVAELGCGAVGYFTLPIAKLIGNDGVLYAVDVLKPALESIESMAISEGVSNIVSVWSDIEVYGGAKQIKNESCDAVMLVNVCFQTQDRKKVLKEALRMLKKGGKLLVIDWNMTNTPYGPPTDHRVKKDTILEASRSLNITKVEQFDAGKYHYGLLFEKN